LINHYEKQVVLLKWTVAIYFGWTLDEWKVNCTSFETFC